MRFLAAETAEEPVVPVEADPLKEPPRPVDTWGMIELELQLVRENPHWLTVLRAYQAAHDELAQQTTQASATPPVEDTSAEDEQAEDEEATSEDAFAGRPRKSIWLPRLTSLDDIQPEELSRTHGGLIAYGLLKCDLADRSTGVVYQLTSVARQVIERETDGQSSPQADAA
ncbi:MAG: hypothetical protein O2820_08600 [Planctomycetota bacterium]|nr:hypothetical protein [Planctomycetota bacterium]MDA1249270.1 hypothetical protein [Planctomycetota bacterium]